MHAQKYTETPLVAETTRRPTEPARCTLSTAATVFWAVYPVVWTCALCVAVSWFLGCTVPLAAVTSGSMEPQTYRGDLLLVVGPDFGGKVRVGDIVLYRLPHRPDTPIVHRVVDIVDVDDSNATARGDRQNNDPAARRWYRTKGDNNDVDDTGLVLPSFPSGLVPHAALVGKVRGQVPLLGYLGLLPIGAKIAIGLACVSWILYGLRADGATPKCDGDDDRITSRRWLLLLLCPVL